MPRPSTGTLLWMMRATWAIMLVASLAFFVFPFFWGWVGATYGWPWTHWEANAVYFHKAWCAEVVMPWKSYLAAALLVTATFTIPETFHRRSINRLRRRAIHAVDPSRPGDYRNRSGTKLGFALPDQALRAAALAYAARLALSLALAAPLLLLAAAEIWDGACFFEPRTNGYCFTQPVQYAPLLVLAAVAVAAQIPTSRRVFGPIRDLCAPRSPSGGPRFDSGAAQA